MEGITVLVHRGIVHRSSLYLDDFFMERKLRGLLHEGKDQICSS